MDKFSGQKSAVQYLYPPVEPFDRRMLDVGDGHSVYMEQSGRADGLPVIVLHGGPGGGCSPAMRRYFDPKVYRIILFDQRGCGRSRPHASVEANTTWHLVADIETIRETLGIDEWIVFGGSWGATLALLYAQAHPDRIRHLVLRGVFTMTEAELNWFYGGGAGSFWPETWARFVELIPEQERDDLITAYHRRLFSGNLTEEVTYAKAWSAWENALATVHSTGVGGDSPADYARAFARLENHYFMHRGFLDYDGQILDQIAKIAHIPGTIVQGRYDMICPPATAHRLAERWGKADLRMIPVAGHALSEPGVSAELVGVMQGSGEAFEHSRFYRLPHRGIWIVMETLPDLYTRLVAEGKLTRDPAQEALLPEFERIRAALAESPRKGWFRRAAEPPKGLYIWGGVGRGKSMLMDLFVETLDVPSRRVHFHAFMQEIHAGLHAARARNEADALAPVAAEVAKSVRLLAFDEMQITDITDAMIVGRLFEALFTAGVVVVTTSNRLPDDLYKDGLNRQLFLPFIKLLKERMVIHEMVSPTDYRQDRLIGSPSYFTPINADSRAEIETIWQDLTGGRGGPHTIIVNKRAVEIPAFHNGVARATFYDLCGNPLGPADYLALAEAARVLILENIPELGRSNFNEAKRFVTLIDALYEARVRLICSAAAVPEYLYIEGEGSFEFERTASRMREMQSEGWGEDA